MSRVSCLLSIATSRDDDVPDDGDQLDSGERKSDVRRWRLRILLSPRFGGLMSSRLSKCSSSGVGSVPVGRSEVSGCEVMLC